MPTAARCGREPSALRSPPSYEPREIRQSTNRTRATVAFFVCVGLGASPIFCLPEAIPLKALRTQPH